MEYHNNELLIFDGRHLLWRTSDAFSDLCSEVNGEEIGTGGIYGFLSVAVKVHEKYKGKVVIAWEGKNNFRYKLYPGYKDRGEPDPDYQEFVEDMRQQEFRLKAILRAIGVNQYYGIKCEADDVIGTLTRCVKDMDIFIYSGDSDLHQLVTKDNRVKVISPGRGNKPDKIYDYESVKEKHGVRAEQIPDLKALAGDSADKIPGVKGIGPKTAAKLINQYGDISKIFRVVCGDYKNWPVADRFKKMVEDSGEDIYLFRKLTEIKTDAQIKSIKTKRSQKKVVMHLMAYKFHSLLTAPELKALMRLGK